MTPASAPGWFPDAGTGTPHPLAAKALPRHGDGPTAVSGVLRRPASGNLTYLTFRRFGFNPRQALALTAAGYRLHGAAVVR